MIYVFEDYELDMSCYELRRGGEPLHIEPKVFELLAYFVQHHGQFISKENLYEHLWPDQYVSESALTYCVTSVRKAIGDRGRSTRLIKTVYGRGYRFVAPVEERLRQDMGVEAASATAPQVEMPHPASHAAETAPPTIVTQPELPPRPPTQEAAASGLFALGDPPLRAERRQLTVLWCRLVAFPMPSGPSDPEDLYEVIQDAYRRCAEVIRRFEGHIAQHFGDGFMVYFGYPLAHEDDAHRAVRTGLGMVQEMTRFNQGTIPEGDPRPAVRLGIHTGMMVMDDVRSGTMRERLALGDTPHIAAQLSDISEPNTVVISLSTLRLIEAYFVCRALGAYLLDDLPQPLGLYQVLAEGPVHSRPVATVKIGLTPFVGRREALGLLQERWEQVQQGMGQVVLLNGEAGIGKSRLVHVFQERLADEMPVRIVWHCSPYYQNSAFYPVVEYLQQRMQWHHDEAPQSKLHKLEAALRSYGMALEEAVPLFASLLSLPLPESYAPLNMTPQRQKQKTLDALLALLRTEMETQSLCVLMEDLHWADASTLEWVGLLIDQAHTARLLLVLTFRPDFLPPWAVRPHITHMALSRLPARQVERMIKRITHGKALPAEVMQPLILKSDGVPLFVEELTKMVLESGLLKERENAYEPMGPVTPLAIPSTLQDSLVARLDRLDALGSGREVIQLGATLGREFSYLVMQALTAMDKTALQHVLSQLVDAELLHQQGTPPQAQYVFKHVLVQEAAYQSMLRRTRRQYHQQIAQVLEAQFPDMRDTCPELLAHHYTEADLQAQAIVYWQQAARRALEHSAHADAIVHVQQGLAALASLPNAEERQRHEIVLQTMLGGALAFIRGYGTPEVVQAYARALELCQQIGDMPQLFSVLRGLWLYYLSRSELSKASEIGDHLRRLAEQRNEPALLLEAHRALAATKFFIGAQTAVVPHLERCLVYLDAPQTGAQRLQYGQHTGVMFFLYKAWNLWLRGYPDQAFQALHQMMAQSQQQANFYRHSHALILAAVLHQWCGETQAAYERVEASLAVADEQMYPFQLSIGMTFQGWLLAQQGRLEEGIERMQRGIMAYRAMGLELFSTYMLMQLADVYRQAGHIAEGLRSLAEALTLADRHDERWWEAEMYRLKAELLLQQAVPDVSQAETALQQGLIVARKQQAKSLELRATMSLCRLWQQQGKRRQARTLLKQVYGWFTEGHATADLREAKMFLDALT